MEDPIDLQHLDRYVCGDTALLDEILSIYADQAQSCLSRFDPLQDDEDWRDAAHALKGASRGVGSWKLGDLCEEAEAMTGGLPEKTAKRTRCLEEIRVAAQRSIDAARAIRDEGAAGA